MKPVIFTIPFINKDVPGYGLMLMIAFLLAIWWAARRAARSKANPDVILNCGFVALVAGVVGCRAMYVWHYWDQFRGLGSPLNVFLGIVDITRGGLEFYGGFILSLIAVPAWLVLWERVSLRWYLDIIAPSAMLGLAIGRIGCLLNGCCYGGTCELPWSIRFPFGSPASAEQWQRKEAGAALPQELLHEYPLGIYMPISRESLALSDARIGEENAKERAAQAALTELDRKLANADASQKPALQQQRQKLKQELAAASAGHNDLRGNMERYGLSAAQIRALAARHESLPVHPTQIYSTITAGLIAWLLSSLYWRRTRDGQVFFTMLAVEPFTRVLIELIRADNPIDQFGRLTISQFLAIPMVLLGVIGLLVLRRISTRSPRAVEWVPPEERGAPAVKAGAAT